MIFLSAGAKVWDEWRVIGRILLIAGLAMLVQRTAPAQEATDEVLETASATTTTTEVVDFSVGFTRLAALGMPQLNAETKWVRNPAGANRGSGNWQFVELLQTLKGNSWFTPAAADGAGGTVFSVGALNGSATTGKVPEADLEADVKKLMAYLDGLRKAGSDAREQWDSDGGETAAGLLLFATQLAQVGRADLANPLAVALMQLSRNREQVVDRAIDQLGTQRYQGLAVEFFETKNWQAFHDGLAKMITEFPRGWQMRAAAGMLMGPLEARLQAAEPPEIQIDGRPLHEAEAAAVAALDVSAVGGAMNAGLPNHGPWLLRDPAAKFEETSATDGLVAMGLDALPLLHAMIDDGYPVALRSNQYFSSYISSSLSASQQLEARYKGMFRPITRGEIAATLLRETLPDPAEEIEDAPIATLKAMAEDFARANAGKSRAELALVFLTEGSQAQQQEAADVLAKSNDAASFASLEGFIERAPTRIEVLPVVDAYVMSRRAVVKDYFTAYAKDLLKEIGEGSLLEDNYDLPWQLRDKDQVMTTLRRLKAVSDGQTSQALARELARGDRENLVDGIAGLQEMMAAERPVKQLYALLAGAVASVDPEARGRFLEATFSIEWFEELQGGGIAVQSGNRKPSQSELNGWKRLLADRTKFSEELKNEFGYESVRDLTAIALEYSVDPEAFDSIALLAAIRDVPMGKILGERADKRASGGEPEPLPDARKVEAARLNEMVAEIAGLPTSEMVAGVRKFSPDEIAAWVAWTAQPIEPPFPESMRAARLQVVSRTEGTAFGANQAEQFGFNPGMVLDPAGVAELIDRLAADPIGHSGLIAWIHSTKIGPGLEVYVNRSNFAADRLGPVETRLAGGFSGIAEKFQDQPWSDADAILALAFSVREESLPFIVFRVNDGAATYVPDDPNATDLTAQLGTILDEIAASHEPVQLQVLMLSRADAEPVQALLQNRDPFSP